MAKEKEEKILEIPAKMEDQVAVGEAMKHLLAQKQLEYEAIQGKIRQFKTQTIALEERLRTMESEFNSKMKQEKTKFDKEKQAKLTDLSNREDKMQTAERNLIERITNVEQRETTAEKIHAERKQLLDERLKYENLNREADKELKDSITLSDKARDKLDLVATKEIEVNNKLKETKNIQSIIETDKQNLLAREQDLVKQKDNLEKLRDEVTPKIEEYKKITADNEKTIVEIKSREQEIDRKIEQDNSLLAILEDKQRKLQMREIDISTREQDLVRKEIIFKNK